ncbi:MAG: Glyoxalase/bleomycin resistance protein/dioxygenase [Bryobacterales bacterium]|jgi:catechol 2,3-dioxygenase-like lactoylglutathione lyase family enzyme|nr:Glyoxalase/bleomycin resistance protein/dioxygenase [Bryobacterales bacterium]
MKCRLLPALCLGALPLLAQLPAPNPAGVSAGHDIMIVKDLEAATKFWTTLGAEPAQLAQLKMLKFPGVLFLVRQGMNQGGTEGSSVEFIGFKVKNLKDSLAKWEAADIKPMPGATATQAFVLSPDEIKVRVTEDKSLAVPIAADSLGMRVSNVKEARAWYEKWFGADIPGSRITFLEAKGPVVPTKGRHFDRIGLEVKNLEEFCKKLDGAGIKLDGKGYNRAKNMDLAVCLITDPWGTYIEMSEGLAAVK